MHTIRALGSLALLVLAGCDNTPTSDETTVWQAPETFYDVPNDAQIVQIKWDDLLPEGEAERLWALYAELPPLDTAGHNENAPAAAQVESYNVVEDLDGEYIRMPGYLMPLDNLENQSASRFLLVPYYGACIHSPPPPPNQIVYVITAEPWPRGEMWDAVWVEGVLKVATTETDLANTAYTLYLDATESYR